MNQITWYACNDKGIDSMTQKVTFREVPMIIFTCLLYLTKDLQGVHIMHRIYLAL